jgi:hypothetical protein
MASIVHDPAEPVRFQPRDDGPTYLLRVPKVLDRAKYGHAVRAAGGQRWYVIDLAQTARAGIEALLAGEENATERGNLVAEVDAYTAGIKAAAAAWQADRCEPKAKALAEAFQMSPVLEETWNRVAGVYEPLAARMADNETYPLIAGLVAARLFLMGWEGLETPFRRGLAGVPDEVLDTIPSGDLIAIGQRIAELLEPTEARAKNSGSPSSGA